MISMKTKKTVQDALDGFLEGSLDYLSDSIAGKIKWNPKDICVFLLRERGANKVRLACILYNKIYEDGVDPGGSLVWLFKRSKKADEQ